MRAQRYDKFRQVNRFLELVEDVLPALPDGSLRVVDFGSGKSYLTFALHHLLTVVHGREVEIVGLDLKADVVARCEDLADDSAPTDCASRWVTSAGTPRSTVSISSSASTPAIPPPTTHSIAPFEPARR